MIPLETLNGLTQADFVARLGGIYEHSPWVAERALAAGPFASLDALHAAMQRAVHGASPDERLNAYPHQFSGGMRQRVAIAIALLNAPDLIICDSVMPRMDGYGLKTAVQGNPATAAIPIILLTSKASGEDEQKALESGFIDFISKPVQPLRVISRVKRAFEIAGTLRK